MIAYVIKRNDNKYLGFIHPDYNYCEDSDFYENIANAVFFEDLDSAEYSIKFYNAKNCIIIKVKIIEGEQNGSK